MTPFDNYEISPCLRLNQFGVADPKGQTFEVCDPADADVWTLYGHIPGEGVMAIGDFATRAGAEEVFQRITGIPFGSHDEVEARIRVMHAGPRLLGALKTSNRMVTQLWARLSGQKDIKLITEEVNEQQKLNIEAIAAAEGRIV